MTSVMTRLTIVAGIVSSMPASVAAETMVWCGPHDIVTSILVEDFQELREAVGLSEAGSLMEIFASAAGNWTILLTSPTGLACIIAAGENFEKATPAAPEARAREDVT
jgi:hypothetical protein